MKVGEVHEKGWKGEDKRRVQQVIGKKRGGGESSGKLPLVGSLDERKNKTRRGGLEMTTKAKETGGNQFVKERGLQRGSRLRKRATKRRRGGDFEERKKGCGGGKAQGKGKP